MKLEKNNTKRILRDILYKRVPKELIERPKMGFSVPIADWLRGSLSDWAENLLIDEISTKHNYLNQEHIRKLWINHKKGAEDNSAPLWSTLMFQSWYQSI